VAGKSGTPRAIVGALFSWRLDLVVLDSILEVYNRKFKGPTRKLRLLETGTAWLELINFLSLPTAYMVGTKSLGQV
jgi:hypothetical protein